MDFLSLPDASVDTPPSADDVRWADAMALHLRAALLDRAANGDRLLATIYRKVPAWAHLMCYALLTGGDLKSGDDLARALRKYGNQLIDVADKMTCIAN